MSSAQLFAAFLIASSICSAQSFTGALNPTDPNDVFLVTFTVSASTTLHVQSWGYGGSSGAPGGKNAAGTVIVPGGFDPYMSLFSGTGLAATFVASNDDGVCPPGIPTSGNCLDSTLHINSLPAGSYTLALSVFDNFSFAENRGMGTLGDLFIELGNYYDPSSNSIRTPNYAFDITANGLQVVAVTHVVAPPMISKAFVGEHTPLNATITLLFRIFNPGLTTLTGIAFGDTLSGFVVDAPGVTAACGGGTLTTTAGAITLAGGSIPPLSSCDISVVVRATGTGIQTNSTTKVTSTEAGDGNAATASVIVGNPIQVRYVSNLTQGDSVINITNASENGASLYGPGFGNPAGNLCVNVYAFSPDEQLVSCCSCLVTPNGLVNLTANRDLVSNTLTGIRPDSLIVKLVSTGASADFTGSSCTNSAALAGTAAFPLTNGMLAWGTTLHSANPESSNAGPFTLTETPFLATAPSFDELSSVTKRCANIIGNGSTFGQCRSCRLGGLGGSKI